MERSKRDRAVEASRQSRESRLSMGEKYCYDNTTCFRVQQSDQEGEPSRLSIFSDR